LNPDGAVKWTLETNGPISATPLLAEDGTILRAQPRGTLGRVGRRKIDSEGSLHGRGQFFADTRTGWKTVCSIANRRNCGFSTTPDE
jgi:hypothetical protein